MAAGGRAVGLCVGSFLNVVIHRLPRMLERGWQAQCAELRGETPARASRATTSSSRARRAPRAGMRITRAARTFPSSPGSRCAASARRCKAPISARYPVVEVLGGLLAACAIWRFGADAGRASPRARLLWTLLALTFIDFDTQLLPDDITLPLLWGGLLVNLFGHVRAAARER